MNQWWFLAFIVWSLAVATGGYQAEKWHLEAGGTKVEAKEAKNLGLGEAKIIADTSKLTTVLSHDTDPCLHDNLPAGTY